MAESKTPERKVPSSSPAGIDPTKAPAVKRIKVPTVRAAAPQPGAAAPRPATPLEGDVVKPATPGAGARPASEAPATEAAARIEAAHKVATSKEPELPAEEKPDLIPNAPRKRRRGEAVQIDPAKQKADEAIRKAKKRAKAFWKKKVNRLVFVGVGLFAVVYSVYSYLPTLAEHRLPDIFAANGIPFKNFKIKTLTISDMELTNVSDMSGSLTVSSLKADFSLVGLFSDNKIQKLHLNGVTINGIKKDDGISLGAVGDLLTSPMKAKKGKELIISQLQVDNSRFVLKSDKEPQYTEDGDMIDDTITIGFNARGALSATGLNMNVSTDYSSSQMQVKTETSLNKNAISTQVRTEVTEGNILKPVKPEETAEGEPEPDMFGDLPEPEKIGSITGTFELSVDGGRLSKGSADLQLSSSSQKLTLKAEVLPKSEGFDLSMKLNRSFENPQDAIGRFVGDLSLEAKNMAMSGSSQKFIGSLPLELSSNSLSNSTLNIKDLKTSVDVRFSCEGTLCSYTLTKPMQFSFNNLRYATPQRQITLYEPLSLTINPDQKEKFLKSDKGLFSFVFPISAFVTKVYVADAQSNKQFAVALNGVKSKFNYNVFSSAYDGNMVFAQSNYVDKDVKMSGVQGAVSFSSSSLPAISLRIPSANMVKPDVLPEFSAEVQLRPMSIREYKFDANFQMQNGLITANANGSYALAAKEWSLYVTLPKIILSEAGLPLNSVLPFMANYLPDSTKGAFALRGRVTIRDGKVLGPVNLLLENMSTEVDDIKVSGINGVLTLSSIYPLATPENQQLFAGYLNAGIPFYNALFNFRVIENQGVQVANVRLKYAEGEFKTIKSFFLPYEGTPTPILMEGSGINLSVVTRNLKSPALRVDGLLDSEWKVSLVDKKLKIDKATFTSKLSGTLHFDAPPSVKDKMDPDMQAFLKDVIVKKMKITAEGFMDGNIKFLTEITGHTPLEADDDDATVSFDFAGNFKNLLKQDGGPIDIPSDVLLDLQNFTK